MDYLIGALLGIVLGGVGVAFLLLQLAGGLSYFKLALTVSKRAAKESDFAKKVQELLVPPPPPKPSGIEIRLLGILQRDARLLDFLMENLQPFSDEQIGSSVREIQLKSQKVLQKHLVLAPVLSQKEGDTVTVPKGFDPSEIQLVGNVTGEPPFRGILQHGGWMAKEVNIQKSPEGHNPFVLMPAEVELA